jgi:alkanesulfonate monooxygenase SsuD/methylene tetrahydromethanopterin reductase-like flavin-dependent oxidoreductase (luciferase family)
VYPRPLQERLPIWVAVGGTPESAARAGFLGLPMALAIIGGRAERFVPFAEIHRRAAEQAGHVPPPALSINSHGLVADTSQAASDIAFPGHELMMNRIGRERGWPPLQRQDFEASRTLHGASFVGSPEEVVEKILFQHELFKHDRFLVQFSVGSVPHRELLRSIELFGTEVAPAIRKAIPSQEGTG